jgi:hypothetical protein
MLVATDLRCDRGTHQFIAGLEKIAIRNADRLGRHGIIGRMFRPTLDDHLPMAREINI